MPTTTTDELSPVLIQEARRRIAPHLRMTPVLRSDALDAVVGAEIFFKCENLQVGGAFKARGAYNAVFSLSADEAAPGVATHSSGNHALALSLAARARGIPAFIVMPRNVARPKAEGVRRAGAEIILCEPTVEAREQAAAEVIARTGATLVHPYNDLRVMAGQGTAAAELLEQAPELDLLLTPVSGGGLFAGTAVAARHRLPGIELYGVEPVGAADARESFYSGKIVPSRNPQTIADGLRASLGPLTFPVLKSHATDILTVSEAGIVRAMRELWAELKIVVEPSSAVPWAALLEHRLPLAGRRVGIILTGGNVDLDLLPWQESLQPPAG
jgi:threonine dehydratase